MIWVLPGSAQGPRLVGCRGSRPGQSRARPLSTPLCCHSGPTGGIWGSPPSPGPRTLTGDPLKEAPRPWGWKRRPISWADSPMTPCLPLVCRKGPERFPPLRFPSWGVTAHILRTSLSPEQEPLPSRTGAARNAGVGVQAHGCRQGLELPWPPWAKGPVPWEVSSRAGAPTHLFSVRMGPDFPLPAQSRKGPGGREGPSSLSEAAKAHANSSVTPGGWCCQAGSPLSRLPPEG